MRKTIVSNRQATKKPLPNKSTRLKWVVLIVFSLLLLLLINYFLRWDWILLLLFILVLAIIVSIRRKKSELFHCFTDGQILYFDFKDTQIETKLVHLPIPISAIRGYKLHAFLGKSPELVQIQMMLQDQLVESRAIPIYYLDKDEQQKLLHFLDAVIVKTKRLNRD